MDKSVVAALIIGPLSFVGGLATVALTHYFGRNRDRETDWRKVKLESYREYFTALSEALFRPSDVAARSRYLNAANQLTLVASCSVLRAFYPYQDASSASIDLRDAQQAAQISSLANSFLKAVREDSHPVAPKDEVELHFKIYTLPPGMMIVDPEKKSIDAQPLLATAAASRTVS